MYIEQNGQQIWRTKSPTFLKSFGGYNFILRGQNNIFMLGGNSILYFEISWWFLSSKFPCCYQQTNINGGNATNKLGKKTALTNAFQYSIQERKECL